MIALNDTFTSTGHKFFHHQEAMANLRNGNGQPIVSHVMLTDQCQHTCAFCSVQARAGDSLPFDDVMAYLDILLKYGLKAVILSGGGNPILYRCKVTGNTFNHVVNAIHDRGLEIGLITNGMPLSLYQAPARFLERFRSSWKTVHPAVLDKLTWVRISMAGLDHEEGMVYVPELDPEKTTLGFSYVFHDIYEERLDPHHGKVSTQADRQSADGWVRYGDYRIADLTRQIGEYVAKYKPKYVRLLPNCLEPNLIAERCEVLQKMANAIDPDVVFVQHKPPAAPKACYLGYVHPVLNCDGWVYPCDSCVLNESAGHKFANPWRVCRWDEVASIYEKPVRSLIADPKKTCPGCVFSTANAILDEVANGSSEISPSGETPIHVNFV